MYKHHENGRERLITFHVGLSCKLKYLLVEANFFTDMFSSWFPTRFFEFITIYEDGLADLQSILLLNVPLSEIQYLTVSLCTGCKRL